jgi:hypothetical protein
MLASVIESCKLHGVNPEAYLTDVLTKLVNNWPNARIAELTPWAWSAALGGGKPKPPVKPFRSWPRLIAYGEIILPGVLRPDARSCP